MRVVCFWQEKSRVSKGALEAVVPATVAAPPPAYRLHALFENSSSAVSCMSANATEVVCGFRDGVLKVFSAKRLEEIRSEVHSDAKLLCVCSLSESCTFSGSGDGSVRLWTKEALAKSPRSPRTFRSIVEGVTAIKLSRSTGAEVPGRLGVGCLVCLRHGAPGQC